MKIEGEAEVLALSGVKWKGKCFCLTDWKFIILIIIFNGAETLNYRESPRKAFQEAGLLLLQGQRHPKARVGIHAHVRLDNGQALVRPRTPQRKPNEYQGDRERREQRGGRARRGQGRGGRDSPLRRKAHQHGKFDWRFKALL